MHVDVLGRTMTCDSGRVLSNLVSRRNPEISHTDPGYVRYGKVAATRPQPLPRPATA